MADQLCVAEIWKSNQHFEYKLDFIIYFNFLSIKLSNKHFNIKLEHDVASDYIFIDYSRFLDLSSKISDIKLTFKTN